MDHVVSNGIGGVEVPRQMWLKVYGTLGIESCGKVRRQREMSAESKGSQMANERRLKLVGIFVAQLFKDKCRSLETAIHAYSRHNSIELSMMLSLTCEKTTLRYTWTLSVKHHRLYQHPAPFRPSCSVPLIFC